MPKKRSSSAKGRGAGRRKPAGRSPARDRRTGSRSLAQRRLLGAALVMTAVVVAALMLWKSDHDGVAAKTATTTRPAASTPSPAAPAAATAVEPPRDLPRLCGGCHAVPQPDILPKNRWPHLITYMNQVIAQYDLGSPPLTPAEEQRVTRYYVAAAPAALPVLPTAMPASPLAFTAEVFADPPDRSLPQPPFVANVNVVDLDRDRRPDVLIADARANRVTWARRDGDGWSEETLGDLPAPAHTEVADMDGDGDADIVVAFLGSDIPTDEPVGGVALLVNEGDFRFTERIVYRGVGRVADARPADLDGDGDLDLVTGVFGGWVTGHIAWLEQRDDGSFTPHVVYPKNGAVHVPPVDLDGDGDLDFIALVAQAHEEIVAFLNLGDGRFEPRLLWQAGNPLYGSSGLSLVDLDEDGDLDLLFTNGDALDIDAGPKPYHGVQWLENRGGLDFAYHDLLRLYGAYRALAGDLDGDGDLDLVVTSQYNRWQEPERQSLIWLENDGQMGFTPHGIATRPTHLVTAALADLDGDGRLDVLAGGMHIVPPFDRVGRLTLWRNLGRR